MRRDHYGPTVALRPDPSSEIEQLRRQVGELEAALLRRDYLMAQFKLALAAMRMRPGEQAQVIV